MAASVVEADPAANARRSARYRRFREEDLKAFGFVLPLVAMEIVFVAVPLLIGAYYSLFRIEYFELTSFRGLGNYVRVLSSPTNSYRLRHDHDLRPRRLLLTLTVGMGLALQLERDTRWNVAVRAVARPLRHRDAASR